MGGEGADCLPPLAVLCFDILSFGDRMGRRVKRASLEARRPIM